MPSKLRELFAANATRPRGYRVQAAGDEATVYLYDAIGGWFGILPADFIRDLNALTAGTIHLRINSPGGDVFDARAIATAIRAHGSKVIAHVDGVAASAATFIAIAADEVEMSEGAFFMIHNAWTMTMGNAAELRETADLLDKVDASLLNDYAAKTGASAEQIAEWMAAETWFTVAEAKEHGFVDRVTGGKAAENKWDLSAYANAPAALAAKPEPDPIFDRETIERRVAMLECIG